MWYFNEDYYAYNILIYFTTVTNFLNNYQIIILIVYPVVSILPLEKTRFNSNNNNVILLRLNIHNYRFIKP